MKGVRTVTRLAYFAHDVLSDKLPSIQDFREYIYMLSAPLVGKRGDT